MEFEMVDWKVAPLEIILVVLKVELMVDLKAGLMVELMVVE